MTTFCQVTGNGYDYPAYRPLIGRNRRLAFERGFDAWVLTAPEKRTITERERRATTRYAMETLQDEFRCGWNAASTAVPVVARW